MKVFGLQTGRNDLLLILCIAVIFMVLLLLYMGMQKYRYRLECHRLREAAIHDNLTKGMNRIGFQKQLEKLLFRQPDITAALILLDVENFKLINDQYGMKAGDDLLKLIYEAIQQNLHPGEYAARGEADCFFLFLRTCDRELIRQRICSIQDFINRKSDKLSVPMDIRLKQGACVLDGTQTAFTVLQDRARFALHRYVYGKGCVYYSEELLRPMQREKQLNSIFLTSLQQHDFQLYLQPKISLKEGVCHSAEALVRWQHPQLGSIYPSEFIPVFEKSEHILALDCYMFEEVCRYLHSRSNAGLPPLSVSINLSRRHFHDLSFLQDYAAIKQRYGIADAQIELELTESMLFNQEQIAVVQQAVVQMHELGFCCSLDDFGAGFSSLGLLKSFAVDAIKLDRIFFEDIHNSKAKDILHCLIDLAQRLHIRMIAEGIETKEQLEFLNSTTCDMAQGYYFSKPLPPAQFEAWLIQFNQRAKVNAGK